MKIIDYFRKPVLGLFIKEDKEIRGAFDNVNVDHVLSRALYSSSPADGADYERYALGNYCTKSYIDMFSWFVGIPEISAASSQFTQAMQLFITKNTNRIFQIYRQTMIDGVSHIWLRVESDVKGRPALAIKHISIDAVCEGECIQDLQGRYVRFVFESVEKWREAGVEKKAVVQITLEAGLEKIKIDGDIPPSYQSKESVSTGLHGFVPVFSLFNNKMPFLKKGIPEIAAAVPFIGRYNEVLKKLGKHLDTILDPKMKVKTKDALSFLRYSFGLSDENLDAISKGKESLDITRFKAAMLEGDGDDVGFINQTSSVNDAVAVLKLLHWIIVELTMPEYLYGTAMQTTNASVSEQSPVWTKKVEGRRGEYNDFFYWLADAFYLFQSQINGRDIYMADGGTDTVSVHWAELAAKDDAAVMNALSTFISAISKAMDMCLVSPQTAFNAIKTFIAIPSDFKTENEEAQKWLALKLSIEALQERLRSGDVDIGDALHELFKEFHKK